MEYKGTIRIVRMAITGFVLCIISIGGCSKLTESSDIVKIKELEIKKMRDSLDLQGELRELELEGELQKMLIEKGKSESTSLCFDC